MKISRREYFKKWCAANQDKIRAARARYNDKHPQRVKKAKRDWKARNRDRVRAVENARRRRPAYRAAENARQRSRYVPKPRRRGISLDERRTKARLYARAKRKENPIAARACDRREYYENAEKLRAFNRARRAALTDCYVAQVLGLPVREIPATLIRAKKAHLQLRRTLKRIEESR